MTKPLLISICLFIAFASCKKASNPTPVAAFSATVDGTFMDFGTSAVAQFSGGDVPNSNLLIGAVIGTGSDARLVSITIRSASAIAPGITYTNSGTSGSLILEYIIGNPATGWYITDLNKVYPSTVTITALTSTSIQGTFSGRLLYTDNVTVKTITGGSFNATIK